LEINSYSVANKTKSKHHEEAFVNGQKGVNMLHSTASFQSFNQWPCKLEQCDSALASSQDRMVLPDINAGSGLKKDSHQTFLCLENKEYAERNERN
jgi:hypothetical protein